MISIPKITMMMIPTAPITLDDMRWSEAEVRLLMEEFNAVLLTFNSFLLISIDSLSEREAFVQMQWHNVTLELFSVPSATDDSLTFRLDCVVATVPSDDDVVTGIDELVWEGHDTVFVGFSLLPKKHVGHWTSIYLLHLLRKQRLMFWVNPLQSISLLHSRKQPSGKLVNIL